MKYVFADTLYFLAIISPSDQWHDRAIEATSSRMSPLLTTTWVLAEVADGLAGTQNRHLTRQLWLDLTSDPNDIILPADNDQFVEGLHLYSNRPDKAWSLTDCISFVVMEQHGVTEALTADQHFEQAGYVALLG